MSADLAAIYRACAQHSALELAEPLADRGATLDEVRARCAVLEELRREFPIFSAEADELLTMFVRDITDPCIARELARLVARRFAERRATP